MFPALCSLVIEKTEFFFDRGFLTVALFPEVYEPQGKDSRDYAREEDNGRVSMSM